MKKVAAKALSRAAALTPEQLSQHLAGVPTKTIRAKIRAGVIPHVRGFSKPYLIPISYLISMGFVPEPGDK